jgi:hypothetical protein
MRSCITSYLPDEKMAEYLMYVATERMGLHETREHALEIVAILQDWKTTVEEKYAQDP